MFSSRLVFDGIHESIQGLKLGGSKTKRSLFFEIILFFFLQLFQLRLRCVRRTAAADILHCIIYAAVKHLKR